jgi:hypothetical protein
MKNPTKSCRTPFNSDNAPAIPPAGGFASRERCLSVSTEEERQKAVKLIQQYRSQEEIAAKHDIEGMSHQLGKLSRESQTSHGEFRVSF